MTPGLAGCVGGVLAGSSALRANQYLFVYFASTEAQSPYRIGRAGEGMERKQRNQPVVRLSGAICVQ